MPAVDLIVKPQKITLNPDQVRIIMQGLSSNRTREQQFAAINVMIDKLVNT